MLLLALSQRIAQTFAKVGDSHVNFTAQFSQERLLKNKVMSFVYL